MIDLQYVIALATLLTSVAGLLTALAALFRSCQTWKQIRKAKHIKIEHGE